jgi:hypothetical protein
MGTVTAIIQDCSAVDAHGNVHRISSSDAAFAARRIVSEFRHLLSECGDYDDVTTLERSLAKELRL